jgi:hypothetical protein
MNLLRLFIHLRGETKNAVPAEKSELTLSDYEDGDETTDRGTD